MATRKLKIIYVVHMMLLLDSTILKLSLRKEHHADGWVPGLKKEF